MERENKKSFTFLKGKIPVGWNELTPYPILYGIPDKNIDYDVNISVEYFKKTSAVVNTTIINKTSQPLYISKIRWSYPLVYGSTPNLVIPSDSQPFFYSTENYRGDVLCVGSSIGDRYIKPYPNETVEIGWSEDHVFPGVFIFYRWFCLCCRVPCREILWSRRQKQSKTYYQKTICMGFACKYSFNFGLYYFRKKFFTYSHKQQRCNTRNSTLLILDCNYSVCNFYCFFVGWNLYRSNGN